ncbi:unnamed protein product [Cochlearia groenlandica]
MFVEMHLSFQKSGKKTRRKILAVRHCICAASPSLLPVGDDKIVYLHCNRSLPLMSCDGLVCFPGPVWIHVLNPSTGQFRRFTSNGGWSTIYPMGFGRDKVSGSYKVVRMFFESYYFDILHVNTGEWLQLSRPPPYEVEPGRRSACVNGFIYWLDIRGACCCCKLLAFDLHTHEFHDVPLQEEAMRFNKNSQIVNLEDHLAIATTSSNWELEIWSMDVDAQERWSKTYSISVACLVISPFRPRWYRPVIVSKQGNVLICNDTNVVFKFCQRTNTIREISPNTCIISPFLENMVRFENDKFDARRTEIACFWDDRRNASTHVVVSSFLDKFLCQANCENIGLGIASYLSIPFPFDRFCNGDAKSCVANLIYLNCYVYAAGNGHGFVIEAIYGAYQSLTWRG